MVRIQSEIKRGTLRWVIFLPAKSSATLLTDAIDGFGVSGYAKVKSGQILVSAGGGGYNSSLKVPGLSDQITPENFAALAEEFRNVYDDAAAMLIANGNLTPTDDDIFSAMLSDDRLRGIRQQQGDHTSLNIPSLGGIPIQ